MMIVDLVDEQDFTVMLNDIGLAVGEARTVPEVETLLCEWLASDGNRAAFDHLVVTLRQPHITVLPEVSALIDRLS